MRKGEIEGRLDCYYIQAILFNSLKSTFESYPLNKLVSTFSGGTPNKSTPHFWNGHIFWVSPKDFKSFEIRESEDTITEEGLKNSSSKLVTAESVLVVVRSGVLQHTLPVAINKVDLTINQDIKALEIKDTSKLMPYYLAIYLKTFQDRLLPLIVKHSTTVQSINTEQFDKIRIPVPPLDIQIRIVAIFNDAHAEKRAKEDESAALLSSIDGYLLDALGICPPPPTERKRFFYTSAKQVSGGRFDPFYHQDEFEELEKMLCKKFIIKFDSLIKVITKGETPLWKGENYVENGIPFLKVQNISVDGIIGELNYIEERLHHKMLRSKLKGGELLYTMAGSIGIATILPTNFGEANINQAIAKIILKSDIEINHYYLVSVVNSTICRKQAQRFLTVSAQPNINFEQIKQIRIPLPPLAVQTEIADHIAALRARARQLTREASEIVEQAKRQVEQMILGA